MDIIQLHDASDALLAECIIRLVQKVSDTLDVPKCPQRDQALMEYCWKLTKVREEVQLRKDMGRILNPPPSAHTMIRMVHALNYALNLIDKWEKEDKAIIDKEHHGRN